MPYTDILTANGLSGLSPEQDGLQVMTPVDGSVIASVPLTPVSDIPGMVDAAHEAFLAWRTVPAPRRGELVRLLGDELRKVKEELGRLVTVDCGKIYTEGLGEVQEMIDICDFAVGLSRQLYGLTIASERPDHRMMETWHPLGVTVVISAFNFPVAVWAWNTAIALVCGNPVIWKPSEKTPLTAMACHQALERAMARFGEAPDGLHQLVIGDGTAGNILVEHEKAALVSATGSTRMGREVAPKVAARFGRSLLELGGNAAMIVTPSADMDLAVRAIVFSAVGTCGQRCTSLRRILVHESVREELTGKLKSAYESVTIGDPLAEKTLVGPMIDEDGLKTLQAALNRAVYQGGKVITGGKQIDGVPGGVYVQPALVDMPSQTEIVTQETFGPLLYIMTYTEFTEALEMQNSVPQGLSSSIFTTDVREAEAFVSAAGSDCGIANVNIGPSGAEIGGAFGGEKETGGGRESGSDAWKAYMRRQTNTVNYSNELPLAQGVKFDL